MERQTLRGKVTHDNKLKGKLSNLAYDMREKKTGGFGRMGIILIMGAKENVR